VIPPGTLVADLPETHVDELHKRIVDTASVFHWHFSITKEHSCYLGRGEELAYGTTSNSTVLELSEKRAVSRLHWLSASVKGGGDDIGRRNVHW
jgi:hypothetical protein